MEEKYEIELSDEERIIVTADELKEMERLSEEAITEIQRIAKEERRSVSAMIEELIWRRKEGKQ